MDIGGTMMQLTWRFVLKNIVPIIAAIITVGGLIFVNTYFKPDLRYEEGSYYRSGDRAITSLRVQNYGHGDAEEIRVTVGFPDTILDVTSGEDANPFTVKSGGKGSKAVSGTIHRLVPNESIYLYFAVKNPDGPIPPSYHKFVAPNGVVYKGGIAKEGKPSDWLPWLMAAISFVLTVVSFVLASRQIERGNALVAKSEKTLEENKTVIARYDEQLKEMETLIAKNEKTLEENKTLIAKNEKTLEENKTLIAKNDEQVKEIKTLEAKNDEQVKEPKNGAGADNTN